MGPGGSQGGGCAFLGCELWVEKSESGAGKRSNPLVRGKGEKLKSALEHFRGDELNEGFIRRTQTAERERAKKRGGGGGVSDVGNESNGALYSEKRREEKTGGASLAKEP